MSTRLSIPLVFHRGRLLPGLVILAGLNFSPGIRAVQVPLHFGMTAAAYDEQGRLLPGTAAAPGALVHLLHAEHGVHPPQADGSPHPDNPVLGESRIGMGVDPALWPRGKTAGSVVMNRYQKIRFFARVYNRETTGASSFYADSAVYTNSITTYDVFRFSVGQTDQPIDTADDDGDGLINAWERSLGSDPGRMDTDGDGLSDGQEFLAGTDLLDASDYLRMVELVARSTGEIAVRWESVPGKIYQVQRAPSAPDGQGLGFVNMLDPVTAEYTITELPVPAVWADEPGHFRVMVIP
jgi:hypothetical protein